jgi:G:T/U-mismatch repair DNA glycosylase
MPKALTRKTTRALEVAIAGTNSSAGMTVWSKIAHSIHPHPENSFWRTTGAGRLAGLATGRPGIE